MYQIVRHTDDLCCWLGKKIVLKIKAEFWKKYHPVPETTLREICELYLRVIRPILIIYNQNRSCKIINKIKYLSFLDHLTSRVMKN